jgi:phosphatidylinositol alpha-1,6-mannosyltransferase
MNRAYGRARRVYCISEYTAKRIKEQSPRAKTEVVLLGVTAIPHVPDAYLVQVSEKYAIEGHFPVFITVGQIKHRKGQLDTLQALAQLKREFPNLLYIMVGRDDDKVYVDAIKSYAKENDMRDAIRIISGADDTELSALYSLSDVFCLNSNNDGEHFEGFGLVFLEAAQFGLAGIGSRDCGIESALKDGYSGYLTLQGDPHDIAEKMRELLKEGNREKMGGQALEYASRFNWEEAAKRFVSEYE